MSKYAVVWLTNLETDEAPVFENYRDARVYKDEHPEGKLAAVVRIHEEQDNGAETA